MDTAQAIKIVKEVEKHPCLYDSNLKEYNNRDITDEAWAEVANVLNLDENQIRDKWQNFRTVYRRSRARANKYGNTYYLAEAMKFLDPFLKTKNPVHNTAIRIQPQLIVDEEEYEEKVDIKNLACSERSSTTDDDDIKLDEDYFQSKSVDEYLTEYLSIKKAKIEKTENDPVRESKRMFLLSLLPDLNSMSNAQSRAFKRRSICLIEEILEEAYSY